VQTSAIQTVILLPNTMFPYQETHCFPTSKHTVSLPPNTVTLPPNRLSPYQQTHCLPVSILATPEPAQGVSIVGYIANRLDVLVVQPTVSKIVKDYETEEA